MHKMASAFNTSVLALEDELMTLILEGQINARIDSHNKVYVTIHMGFVCAFICVRKIPFFICGLLLCHSVISHCDMPVTGRNPTNTDVIWIQTHNMEVSSAVFQLLL